MAMLFTADHFTTVVLVAFVVSLVLLEKKYFGTYLSPISLISVPYTSLVLVINFVAIYFGYFTISYKANLLIILFLGLFFMVGLIIRQLFPHEKFVKEHEMSFSQITIDEFQTFYRIIAIIAVVAGVLQFRRVIGQTGLINMGSPLFKELYGGGLLSHIMLLSRPAFFILFASTVRRWNSTNVILLFMIFIMVVAPQIKYQIIVLIISAVIFSINQGIIKVTVKKTLFALASIYFLFNISYVIGFSASGLDYAFSDKVQAFLFNHFFTYLFGGPIGFSEILEMRQYPYLSLIEVLAVPTNIYKTIIGDSQYAEIIIRHWLPISTITQYFHSTNTFGLFGMLYAFTGIAGTGLFIMMYAVLVYTIFLLSMAKQKRIAFQIAYAYIGSYLVLSFFGMYINMLSFYEVLVYSLVLQYFIQNFRSLNRHNQNLLKQLIN